MLDRTAFGALIKRKRGEKGWSQENLATEALGDSGRKGDISRIENARTKPNEITIQRLCTALSITDAEMEPIRRAQPYAAQLDQIPSLSREELENLAFRFGIGDADDRSDRDLRGLLTEKAKDYKALRAEVAAIPEGMRALANLKAAAEEAMERADLDEVEHLLSQVHDTEREEAARTAELRADTAILRSRLDEAYALLADAADAWRRTNAGESARRRLRYEERFYRHALRFGGNGLALSARMIKGGFDVISEDGAPRIWAQAQNALGIALQTQGSRTAGPEGTALLTEAVAAFRAALRVRTEADHPLQWATTQQNLGNALRSQGSRTAGPEGATLLTEAVAAYRDALRVRTEADHPVDWAMTQQNLGGALQTQGSQTAGPEGAALLTDAVAAYRAALRVTTEADHPVHWAMAQGNLAIAEQAIADHDTTADPRPHLEAALAHVDAALTVYDPEHMPYDHGTATELRNRLMARLSGD